MDASNEGSKQISPFHDALLSVSDGLDKKEVNRLKFLCRRIKVDGLKYDIPTSQLETVEEGYQLFEILEKLLIITETSFSFLFELLDSIGRKDLKIKFKEKMHTACRSPGLGSYARYVHSRTDLRAPRDFAPISPSQAVVTHTAPTRLFADIPKPPKDNFTGTNDSPPENTSGCDQSLHMANTLPKSATNNFPGQSQHLSQTLPRSRSEGLVSSIDEGPCEMKAVYNVDGTPRATASNGRSLHTSQTFPRLDKSRVSEEPASSIDESPKMKAVYNVDGTPRTTASDDQSPHTSKTFPRSRSVSERPSFPLMERKGDVDDTPGTTPGATPRNGQSPYTSETFPRSVKRSASAGPALFTNGSPGTEAGCTPRTPTRDARSLYISQTVPRSATRSLSYGPASSSDRNPGMKADLSASRSLSGKPMFHPKVSKSSGGNDGEGFGGQASGRDVENLLEWLSLQDSSTSHDLPEDVETDSPFVPQKQPSLPNNGHGGDAASLLAMSPETDSPTSSHQPRDDRRRHVVSSPHHGPVSVPWPSSPQQEMEVMQRAGEEFGQGQSMDSLGETTVWCKKCPATFICSTAELRWKGDNGHVTCISPSFTARVRETVYRRPLRSGNIETLGIVHCGACSQQFGIIARFLRLDPQLGYALNVESFKFQRDGITRTHKKWNQVLS